jgi:hypothetical protein
MIGRDIGVPKAVVERSRVLTSLKILGFTVISLKSIGLVEGLFHPGHQLVCNRPAPLTTYDMPALHNH